jgi:hypothetical protein
MQDAKYSGTPYRRTALSITTEDNLHLRVALLLKIGCLLFLPAGPNRNRRVTWRIKNITAPVCIAGSQHGVYPEGQPCNKKFNNRSCFPTTAFKIAPTSGPGLL